MCANTDIHKYTYIYIFVMYNKIGLDALVVTVGALYGRHPTARAFARNNIANRQSVYIAWQRVNESSAWLLVNMVVDVTILYKIANTMCIHMPHHTHANTKSFGRTQSGKQCTVKHKIVFLLPRSQRALKYGTYSLCHFGTARPSLQPYGQTDMGT